MQAGAKAEGAILNAASKVEAHNSKKDDSKHGHDGAGNDSKSSASSSSGGDGPPGGFDDTPIPEAPPGYTLKVTFHRATNLPMADIGTFSSDPYILATMVTGLPTRHQEDPPLALRTPTIRRSTEPEWNADWIIANVPASGFKLVCRIMDEDPADHDDRLGKAILEVQGIDESWPGIRDAAYKIKKKTGSKRAYLLRGLAVALRKTKHMDGSLFISVENLGRTKAENGGRAYTIGPMWWTKHYSPMLGRLAHTQDESENSDHSAKKYNFQANQFQLHGPVPPDLYHRFVEFKPFVKRMFKASGLQGFLLSKALHHQHNRVYNFDRTTEYGVFEGPSKESTIKFLELVNWDQGGRIYTYVLTLDALMRFTETGKEFGIDFLSKHTMHSDVSIYIAFSGEFFVRRLKYKNRPTPEEHLHEASGNEHTATKSEDEPEPKHSAEDQTEEHPPKDISDGSFGGDSPRDPEYYELVIDNDSGTYRPNAHLLPQLKAYLRQTLPGLHIVTLDCQADADLQQRMKKEQRERKKQEGDNIVYKQTSHPGDDDTSISSSDISDLDDVERQASDDPTNSNLPQHKSKKDDVAAKMARAKARKHQKDQELWKSLGKDYYEKGKSRGQKYKFVVKGRDGEQKVVERGESLPIHAMQVEKVPVGEDEQRQEGQPVAESKHISSLSHTEHGQANESPSVSEPVAEEPASAPEPSAAQDSKPNTNGIDGKTASTAQHHDHLSSGPDTTTPETNGVGLDATDASHSVKRKPVSAEFKPEDFKAGHVPTTLEGTSHV